MNEFNLIKKYFSPLSSGVSGAFGLTDDASVLCPTAGKEIIITKDAITESVHFMPDANASEIAWKLLRVNLSDIAAMGGEAKYYLIAAMLPKSIKERWIREFATTLRKEQDLFGVSLIGGDTVVHNGPISLSLTMIGEVKKGKAVRRTMAKAGDLVFVSGTIGDAALGLAALKGKLEFLSKKDRNSLINRYKKPEPRMDLGRKLPFLASAAIDISDGLLADAGHMSVGMVLEQNKIPLSPAAAKAVSVDKNLFNTICSGGDDYEILFTVSPEKEKEVNMLSIGLPLRLTKIGVVNNPSKIRIIDEKGKEIKFSKTGYQHFS